MTGEYSDLENTKILKREKWHFRKLKLKKKESCQFIFLFDFVC